MRAPRDPGLPAERTRLAWRRTALAGTAVALLTARLTVTSAGMPSSAALLALTALCWVGMLLVAFRRLRAMGPDRPVPVARAWGLVLLTVGYAILGIVLVLAAAPS